MKKCCPPSSNSAVGRGTTFFDSIVAKVYLWVYGVNSPTRRIMENEVLFTNVQENMQH
ncbi:hypothetical protein AVEN_173448-1, partial [Araneus ventricosus]